MANATTVPALPNPFTPLAFFPPDAAWQITIFYYSSVGTLAVFVWDILNNLKNDYKILSQYRLNLPTAIYFLSRWSNLAYLLTNVIQLTAPIGNCEVNSVRTVWLYPVAVGSTALLFFIRVRAIYLGDKAITAFFLALWLGVVVGASTIPFTTRGAQIGPTKYCYTSTVIPRYLTTTGIITLIFDTSVYLAISWKLTRNLHISKHRSDVGIRALFTGENLPMFSKGLLQDGQIYYLSTASVHLMATILFNIDSLPFPYRVLLGPPTGANMNIMACRVYRSTKFGLFQQVSVSHPSKQALPSTRDTAVTVEFSKTEDRDTDVELGIMRISGKSEQL